MASTIQYIKIIHIVLLASPLLVFGKDAENSHELEEVVVTTAFQKTAAETGLPVTVLGGEKLLDKVANSLEETLKDEIGISSASIKNFAPDTGRGVVIGLRLTC